MADDRTAAEPMKHVSPMPETQINNPRSPALSRSLRCSDREVGGIRRGGRSDANLNEKSVVVSESESAAAPLSSRRTHCLQICEEDQRERLGSWGSWGVLRCTPVGIPSAVRGAADSTRVRIRPRTSRAASSVGRTSTRSISSSPPAAARFSMRFDTSDDFPQWTQRREID